MIATEGSLSKCDVIEYDGKFWLVPMWLDDPATGETRPARIICLSNIQHTRSATLEPEFVVNYPIPRAILDGRAPPGSVIGFVVIERPDIVMRGGVGLQ